MTPVLKATPPLSSGDFLTRDEFLRRWENEPTIKRAELIQGVVYMPSPVSIDRGEAEFNVGTWVGVYKAATPGTSGAHNATVVFLEDVPQPDVLLRILPECGGASWIEGKYLHGPPELVVEVCKSSAAYDLHQKLEIYQEAGVREYLAVVLFERTIRWLQLSDGAYRELSAEVGIWKSQVFPGLWLNGPALFAEQSDQVLATLQQGIASPEHREFVERLMKLRTPS